MSLSENPAVRQAYEAGTYTDTRGLLWKRGMDGWFMDGVEDIYLARHHDFVEMIEQEHPQ